MSRPYLSAFSFRSHRLIATASERSGATNEISSLKPFCFRSRVRTSFSSVYQIFLVVCLGVVAVVQLGGLLYLPDHDRRLGSRVLHDDPDRLLERAANDVHAGLLVVIGAPDLGKRLLAPQERHAAALHDALLDRSAGGLQRVLDPGLLLLHFGLGGGPLVHHRDAARQLRRPLLQLLLVVIRRR